MQLRPPLLRLCGGTIKIRMTFPPPRAVIIGASSGIGRALAVQLAQDGYSLGLTARRLDLLETLQKELPSPAVIQTMDAANPEESVKLLEELIGVLGGMDLIVINAGINKPNPDLLWEYEKEITQINAVGFMALADFSVRYFLEKGSGHLAAVSSIAGLIGSPRSPAYSASKAFMATYMEGLRFKLAQSPIAVTDLRPGFVDTPMIQGAKFRFWMASTEKAALQISRALRKRRKVVYITRRWLLAAWLLKFMPRFVLERIVSRVKR